MKDLRAFADMLGRQRRHKAFVVVACGVVALLLLGGGAMWLLNVRDGVGEQVVASDHTSEVTVEEPQKEVFVTEDGEEVCEQVGDDEPMCAPVDFVVEVVYSTTEPTQDPVTATIVAGRELLPIEGWEYMGNDRYTRVFKNIAREIVLLTDRAGLRGAALVMVDNIDRVPPKVVMVASDLPTNQTVKAVLTADEPIQDIAGWVREGENTLSKNFSNNTNTEVAVQDLAGNQTSVAVRIANIDRVAPKLVSLVYSTTQPTNQDVTATIKTSKVVGTPAGWTRVNDREFSRVFGANFTGVIYFVDTAGNALEVRVDVVNIDKSALVASVSYAETFSSNTGALLQVEVIVTFNRAIVVPLEGWENVGGRKFSRVFSANVEGVGVAGRDAYGNSVAYKLSVSGPFGERSPEDVVVRLVAQ